MIMAAMSQLPRATGSAKIPSIESTQRTKSTDAIVLNGLGIRPIIQEITINVMMFHNVMGCPLMAKNSMLGIEILVGKSPKTQRMMRMTSKATNILLV